jgi:nicotinate-nucleotide pyrophosphorylase (carboxylating)
VTPDTAEIERIVQAALDEDFRYGPDVTSLATVASTTMTAEVVAREPGILCGIPIALAVVDAVADFRGDRPRVEVLRSDGERIKPGDAVLRLGGPSVLILGAERTMLNFLTHLSGIATSTGAWVDAVEGTGAAIRDTRKTLPGLRALQKYAVRCGGGQNHRMGLGDAALIKDNHIAAAGSIEVAIQAVDRAASASEPRSGVRRPQGALPSPRVDIEVECDTLGQVRESLAAGARLILLDNMSLGEMREAVAIAREYEGVRLEASGGLRLENAREVASTGVDYLAVGALTHSSRALDLGLDVLS